MITSRIAATITVCATSVALAGCGSSKHVTAQTTAPTTSATTSPSPSIAAVPDALSRAIAARMKAQDGSFSTGAAADVVPAERYYADVLDDPERSLATRLGFDFGAYEHVSNAEAPDGVRNVMHFPSAAAAAEFTAHRLDTLQAGLTPRKFVVPGVPNCLAITLLDGSTPAYRNVMFSVGEYAFLLGVSQRHAKPGEAELASAVASWYQAVKSMQ